MSRGRAAARRMALRRLLGGGKIGSQEELVSLLAGAGFRVTQTTVSRDLAAVGAVKVAGSKGEVYRLTGLGEQDGPAQAALARSLGEFAVSIDAALNQAVVRTVPGGASPVAAALDAAVFSLDGGEAGEISGAMGTLAGDDTVLVICRSGEARSAKSGAGVARWLKSLLRPEDSL